MLSANHLSISFGGVHACDDVTLAFETGSTTAIVGPNGAGKSTLVQLLAGVLRPDSGAIALAGRTITRKTVDARSRLGIARTFQTPRIFPGITVWESTMLGAYLGASRERPVEAALGGRGGNAHATRRGGGGGRGGGLGGGHGGGLGGGLRWGRKQLRRNAERIAEEVLNKFGDRLLPRRDDLTYSLSYANRRRVEIARVLAARPTVLLLDEPTAGMNPTETAELTGILADLERADRELTVIVVEHKMAVVRSLAERVIVMDAGRVIADGDPDEVLSQARVIEAYLGSSGKGN